MNFYRETPPRCLGSVRSIMVQILALIFVGSLFVAHAAEVMPPPPQRYFNDYANVVSTSVAQQLEQKLENFEGAESSQVVVAVFPKMQSDSSIEDYTQRIAQNWSVGQKKENNGAVLFVFIEDRKMFIQVGYGLEGALPDAIAKRIVEDEIKPFFKKSDYAGGLSAGVDAILKAIQGEYKGSGQTAGKRDSGGSFPKAVIILLVFAFILFSLIRKIAHHGTMYSGRGRGSYRSSPVFWGGGGGGWGGGSSGGGGFSGGGGSFGGGGAGGSW